MRKLAILLIICILGVCKTQAQNKANTSTGGGDTRSATAKGVGAPRDEALKDALRNAVGQVAGIELRSQTSVENFELISDAIQTRTEGYVHSYNILDEKTDKDGLVNLTVSAKISTKPLKADGQYLARAVGGIRFLVMYDDREFDRGEKALMDFATERINQYLSSKKYRYIEKSRFEQLRAEALAVMQESDTNDLSLVQKLGLSSGAQFILMLKGYHIETKESGPFGTKSESRLVMDLKAYDNCTAEGLGTVVVEGPWKNTTEGEMNIRQELQSVIATKTDDLFEVFNMYVGDWVNNGTPFELRFMGSGGFRDLRELRQRLQADKSFGGQMELAGSDGYIAINCTFRNKPEELADRVLSLADEIEGLKSQRLDVQLIYGRQITFGPGRGGIAPSKPAPKPKKKSGKK